MTSKKRGLTELKFLGPVMISWKIILIPVRGADKRLENSSISTECNYFFYKLLISYFFYIKFSFVNGKYATLSKAAMIYF